MTTGVHHAAAVGFDREAAAYDRGRPSYAPTALDWLRDRLRLCPGRRVLDLAAGTGKLTADLLATGADVVAVEPVDGMRAVLAERLPEVEVLEGTAEALPLADASVHAVTVAQAFHWFATTAALAEMRRVLDVSSDGAAVALVWNRRDLADPVWAAVSELIAPHRGDAPAHASGAWRQAIEESPDLDLVETHEVSWSQELDAAGLADRVGSTSFIATLPAEQRAPLLDQVRSLLPDGRHAALPYTCELHLLRPPPTG